MNNPSRRLFTVLSLAWCLTPALHAQPTAEPLPLRNLQVEVRQARASAAGGPDGQVQGARDLMQRVLVLNGRPVNISLGNSRPLRLMQTYVQNGVVRGVGGTVVIDTNSGFSARPLWQGGASAGLELAAIQSTRGNLPGTVNSSSTSTVLDLPLDEWVTVAESVDTGAGTPGTPASPYGTFGGSDLVRVEVRLSLR